MLTIFVFVFNLLARFEADNWNKMKNLASKVMGQKIKVLCRLKETLDPSFFPEYKSPSLIQMLKYVRCSFRFRADIRMCKNYAVSMIQYSGVKMLALFF